MNISGICTAEFAKKAGAYRHDSGCPNHSHSRLRAMSRRQFARTAAGAAGIGAFLGSAPWRPGLAEAKREFEPVPIPGGTPVLGGNFHIFGPSPDGSFDPINAEPVTITDFDGFFGLTYVNGEVKQTNMATGEILTLPFVDSDMRFVKGVFRGRDGRVHQGAFAFV
ncbi:MAG TPA: hypothetical protein VE398_16875 [Acidobacteriota bacterium]|nr:hypothetical protein [Acidobacteriota bacterium]